MSLNRAPASAAPRPQDDLPDDATLWLHAAFCELGLPVRASRGDWHRDVGSASLRIEASSATQAAPSGRMARLCLLHICDVAYRTKAVTLDLGESATPAADRMGAAGKAIDLIDQMHLLLSAKVSISYRDGQEIPVFDARSRSRGGSSEWRPTIRLGSKFLASLAAHAVALDQRIVRQLADSPMALDAYAWIRLQLTDGRAERLIPTSWADLMQRFGSPSQGVEAFRTTFETALRLVFDADPSIALKVDDEGVTARRASPDEEVAEEPAAIAQPAPAPAPAPAPVVSPAAAPAEGPRRPGRPRNVTLTTASATPAPPSRDPELPLTAAPAAPTPPAPPPVAAAPAPAPQPQPQPQPPARSEPQAIPAADRITQDTICLARHATGLTQGVWLRRGHGEERVLVGVTPGTRLEPERLTVLAVEPIVLQVSGGLYQADFDRVSSWIMANRDLIDDFWDGHIESLEELNGRVRKAPSPGWR